MRYLSFSFLLFLIFTLLISPAQAQSSGGAYSLTHSVVASGGGTMQNGAFNIKGTVGQPTASDEIVTPPYTLRGGFWNPIIAPTAATANIGGRVVTPDNLPIKNAVISLTGGNMFTPRIARTNAFGYFTFEEVEVGHFYVLTVSSKSFGFANMSYSLTLTDNFTDIVFQASWLN